MQGKLERRGSSGSDMATQEQLVEATFEQLFPDAVSEVRRVPNHRVRLLTLLS